MTKLDSNAAWKDASRLVEANREVLFALAGVFFMLPSLALAVILGEPQVEPGMKPEQMMAAMSEFYGKGWWLILLSSLFQVVGVLTILTLMRDRSRPTVGEAIGAGGLGTPSLLGAQLLFLVVFSLASGVLIGVAGVVSPVLAAVAVVLMLLAVVYCGVRLSLAAPIVAVEGVRNPVTVLRRSWTLTRASFWRIITFLGLLLILFVIVLAIVMLIVGTILALVASAETARVIAAVISSALTAIAVVYFCGVIAAIHRQLAGPTSREVAATFE